MESYEIAVLEWLRKQREPVTTAEIHSAFGTLSFATVRAVLLSLEGQNKVEQAPTKGSVQTWRVRQS